MKKMGIVILAAVALAAGLAPAQSKNPSAKDIPANVLEIFKKSCAGCHSGLLAPKGLKLVPGKFASAIDAKSKKRLGEKYELKDGDVIKIVSTK